MSNTKKRYLVTYQDRVLESVGAQSVLQGAVEGLKDGCSVMESADSPEHEENLHFENLAVSSIMLHEESFRDIQARPEVLAVEEDGEVFIRGFPVEEDEDEDETAVAAAAANLWNIDMVRAPDAWARGYTGAGVKLAILDTGIATHPDLVISGGTSEVPGEPTWQDEHGHGTHCAGTAAGRHGLDRVYGVARDADLYAVKVLGKSGGGSMTGVIAGMSWCVTNGMHVASMSLGGSADPSVAYNQAVRNCQSNGVTVVCAAGNSFGSPFPWVERPANSIVLGDTLSSPLAVAAVDNAKRIASFSSRGAKPGMPWNEVTVSAPGVNIYSTYLNDGYVRMSGTSMACPHVAGLAALCYQRYAGISPEAVKEKISTTSDMLGSNPIPNEPFGYGLIDCDAAVQ